MLKNFFAAFNLKPFFHDKEDDSNTSDKDIFETLQTLKSKWTPPEGQSYVKDSQHALQIFRDFNFLGEDKLIYGYYGSLNRGLRYIERFVKSKFH